MLLMIFWICDFLQHFNLALDLGKRELIFQNDSRPNTVSLDVKDRETDLSNSKSMSVNSFISNTKPVHHDSRDFLHEKIRRWFSQTSEKRSRS